MIISKKKIDKFYNELEAFRKINKGTFKNFPLKERAEEFHMTEYQYVEFFTSLELLQEQTILNLFQDKFLNVITDMLNTNVNLEKGFPLTFYELGRKYKNHKETINIISEIYDNDLYICVERLDALIPIELKEYYKLYLKHINIIQDKRNKLINQAKLENEEIVSKPIIKDISKEDITIKDDGLDFGCEMDGEYLDYNNNDIYVSPKLNPPYDSELDDILKLNNNLYNTIEAEDINEDDDYNGFNDLSNLYSADEGDF